MKLVKEYKNNILADMALARRAKGYTQAELSKKVGITDRRLSVIERSKDAKLSTVIKILKELDCFLIVLRGPNFAKKK